jgi:hypothetical protein
MFDSVKIKHLTRLHFLQHGKFIRRYFRNCVNDGLGREQDGKAPTQHTMCKSNLTVVALLVRNSFILYEHSHPLNVLVLQVCGKYSPHASLHPGVLKAERQDKRTSNEV